MPPTALQASSLLSQCLCDLHNTHTLGTREEASVNGRLRRQDSYPLEEAAGFQYVLPYALTLLHFFHLFLGNVKEFNDLF